MTVFCPNCGKPNTDTATKCVSCGTELKPAPRGGKFKGTMMMGVAGGAAGLGGTPPAGPAPGAPPQGGGPVQAGSPAAKQNLAFQQTMLGPMTPPPSGAPPGAAPPQGGGFGGPPQGGPPQGGGFGGPPQGGPPQGGGFGGPPQGGPPPGGGFGAPPGSAPGGGFGAPPGGAPPPSGGGFGAPPPGGGFGGPPPGGGFGGPPGGAPPPGGGGGFGAPPAGGFAPAGAAGAAPSGEKKKSKLPLIIGLGCLFLLIISCSIGGFLYCKAQEAATEFGSSMAAEMNRVSLSFALSGIQMSCGIDPTGAGTAQYFQSTAASTYQAQACQVTDNVANAFSDANRSTATMLTGTGDESYATNIGADPTQCYEFVSGSAKIIACTMPEPEGFKLIHIENLASVQ